MANTLTQFQAGQMRYRVNFDYLARQFVVLTLLNTADATMNKRLVAGVDYRFLSPTVVEVMVSQGGYDIMQIARETSSVPLVAFKDGSVLTASDLTVSELQAIHIAEEGRDQTVELAKTYADSALISRNESNEILQQIKDVGAFGYTPVGSFELGATVETFSQSVKYGSGTCITFWRWDGDLPKVVEPNSTPESAGGIGDGKWKDVTDSTLRGELAGPDGGAKLISTKLPFTGAVPRTQDDKNLETASILDFGASTSDAAKNATAISNMSAALGFVVIPRGNYAVETISIVVPIYFSEGASITVGSGFTVTISNSISSSKQYIFRGEGNYSLTHDVSTGSGENSRQVHASWFGAFPYCNTPDPTAEDQSPYINKAYASMGNARESIVDFDVGNYIIDGEILVTRGGWVKTAGMRRTVFLCKSDGWTAFRTIGPACRFGDIQFELAPYLPARSSPFIQIDHGECEIYNGFLAQSARGIVLNSNNARVDNIMAVYGANPGAGSSLVEITQGSGNEVRNVMAGTSSKFGPEVMVRVGGANQTDAISNFLVENVSHVTPSKTVLVEASSFSIQRGTIRNARYNGYDGTAPDWSIELLTGGSSSIQDVIISDVVLSPMAAGAVALRQRSSGFMRSIILDSVTAYGTTGKGLLLEQTAGNMSSIFVGPNVSVKTRAVPITQTGTMRDVIIAPGILKDSLTPSSTSYTVADDAVIKIEMHRPVYSGRLEIDSIAEFATCSLRTTSPLALTQINASANVGLYLTPLTGTTGVDGKLNIGVSEGFLYIENRTGQSRSVTLTLATGIS